MDPRERVMLPAIFMMVANGLGLLFNLFFAVIMFLGMTLTSVAGSSAR